MRTLFLGLAAALAVPASMALPIEAASARHHDGYNDGRHDNGRYNNGYRGNDRYDNNYRGREWRGRDGRTYCRKSNGTTGLLVGGVGGALAGRAIDSHGDRATGTLLGAAAGALIGKSIDSGRTCR